jgi:hypothetical protein
MKRMLLVSAGMPRAGSGWHYNLMHDLVLAGGGQDAREIRVRYHLERLLTEVNCNLSTLSGARLLPILLPVLRGNTFVIKTHGGPTAAARTLLLAERMMATYIYRDPRAALLSAYEYGQRAVSKGTVNAFSELDSLETALTFFGKYLIIWEKWMSCKSVLKVRYEDLLIDFDQELTRLVEHLQIENTMPGIMDVVDRYRPERTGSSQRGMHYNVGKLERFREIFSPEQLHAFNLALEHQLERMGYQL